VKPQWIYVAIDAETKLVPDKSLESVSVMHGKSVLAQRGGRPSQSQRGGEIWEGNGAAVL